MFVLVSYDIANDRRRHKVCKMMKNYGQRVQYSVFECLLSTEQVKAMQQRVQTLLDPKQDGVRYYLLCETCQNRARIQGIGIVLKEQAARFV